MKAITIKQPWASLIINKYKTYEFRSWKTNYRGKILIHSGLNIEKSALDRFKDYNLDYSLGYIIGEAELVDCIKVDDALKRKLIEQNELVYAKSNYSEEYAFVLENIKKYNNPIKIKGKLGIWNFNNYEMRLKNKPFEQISSGVKTIEIRLNDEKRKLLKKHDIIEFTNLETNEKMLVEVKNIYHFDNFKELYNYFDKASLGYKDNERADYKDMEKYYKKEDIKKYKVLGIEIKKI